ncbi:MAG: succinyldiaminopimelate transaminase [Pseudomonadales bacterium]|nr:succinyldiaminopimelate transaminase [Pseudomonadales bacterium]
MNPNLALLKPYPFERLNRLKSGIQVPADLNHIALSIGEPKHAPPAFVLDTLSQSLAQISAYPKTKGMLSLRQSIASWLEQRFNLASQYINAETQVLPLNGTREGLFSFIQTCVDSSAANAKVLMPNPFYQIYEGATLIAGAEPYFLNCTAENGYLPDFDAIDIQTWKDCQLLILCSPGNPTGTVLPQSELVKLIHLADQYDFLICSDECYSEIYFDENTAPVGLLEACHSIGRDDFSRCLVMHSLSKRSNLPGLRSGFIAGDADVIQGFLQYRTYHGSAMSEPTQLASITAWNDEQHVIENRALYRRKFQQVLETLDGCLDVSMPDAAFYLWARLPEDDELFCQKLFAQQHITALPGQYLSREHAGINPGFKHARLALVATEVECLDAARRIKTFMQQNYN